MRVRALHARMTLGMPRRRCGGDWRESGRRLPYHHEIVLRVVAEHEDLRAGDASKATLLVEPDRSWIPLPYGKPQRRGAAPNGIGNAAVHERPRHARALKGAVDVEPIDLERSRCGHERRRGSCAQEREP